MNRQRRRLHPAPTALLLAVSACWTGSAFGQAANQITGIDPDTAGQGETNLLVSFMLDTDSPPAPPAGIMPDSVTIGGLVGSSVTHASQHVVTAYFDIPTGELPGPKDAAVTFSIPNGTLVYSMLDGFEVTAGEDTPPGIAEHPQSQTVPPGGSVTFSVSAHGTAPLSYRWQKELGDIAGATDPSYTINPVAQADAGGYRCVVTNDHGSASSDEAVLSVAELPTGAFPAVDTAQVACYDDSAATGCPAAGEAFSGQDAQYIGNAPSYALSGDGSMVFDNHTGLTWQRSPDTNRDGAIDAADKLTWPEAQAYPATLNTETFGGFEDWRLPTIKELYSLIDFTGMDPSACETEADCPGLQPFIDADYFDFAYGDISAGDRVIDSQWASSNLYVSTVDGELLFGVNFADGRIKGYGLNQPGGGEKTFYVICVRGNPDYGVNNFIDNGDGTITDLASGLMWMQGDSGVGLLWEDALGYAESLTHAGHDDWRLPNVKELQGILDYNRSPDTTSSAAIDPRFEVTPFSNEEGLPDYPYYWAGTTHARYVDIGDAAAYVAFGRGLGYMNGEWRDVHGAGCQRSDPKAGDPGDYPFGHGPQGDAVRILNHVRAVRDVGIAVCAVDEDCDDDDPCTDDVCLLGGDCANDPLPDTDGDGVCDLTDNCIPIANPQQLPVAFGQTVTMGGYCSGDAETSCRADDDCGSGETCLAGALEWAEPLEFDFAGGEFLTSADIGAYPATIIDSGSGVRFVDPVAPASGTGSWCLLRPSCSVGSWQTEVGREPPRDAILP